MSEGEFKKRIKELGFGKLVKMQEILTLPILVVSPEELLEYLSTMIEEYLSTMIEDAKKEYPKEYGRLEPAELPHFPQIRMPNPNFREEAMEWFEKWFGSEEVK